MEQRDVKMGLGAWGVLSIFVIRELEDSVKNSYRFYKSFSKVFSDELVSGWVSVIHCRLVDKLCTIHRSHVFSVRCSYNKILITSYLSMKLR